MHSPGSTPPATPSSCGGQAPNSAYKAKGLGFPLGLAYARKRALRVPVGLPPTMGRVRLLLRADRAADSGLVANQRRAAVAVFVAHATAAADAGGAAAAGFVTRSVALRGTRIRSGQAGV